MILVSGPRRKYNSISNDNIKEVKFGAYNFKVYQFIYAYNVDRQERNGLLITEHTVRQLAKKVGSFNATLYIKAKTDIGLWELELKNVSLKQLASDVIWFEHKGFSSLKILKKLTKSNSWS